MAIATLLLRVLSFYVIHTEGQSIAHTTWNRQQMQY